MAGRAAGGPHGAGPDPGGTGVIADAYDEEGKATDFVTWVPAVGGVVLLATGVPLVVLGNREARHAVEVYGAP